VVVWPVVFLAAGVASEAAGVFRLLQFAVQRPPGMFPSTVVVPPDEVAARVPLVSVYVDPADLHDPDTGLLENRGGRGREWERPGSVSYFEDGRLRFASGAGIRLHGGLSRRISPVQSYRLYFRRQYGTDGFRSDVLFNGEVQPIREIVLHNDLRADATGRYWHFINPLAYDISERIGTLVPRTMPVRFLLNGEPQGAYVLTEDIDLNIEPTYLQAHYGHDDFAAGRQDFDELWRWLQNNQPWTMETVGQAIDVENLTRWFLSVLFCATEDAFQGAQLRDNRDPASRWFWINWDMDHSFMDHNLRADEPWQHDTFRTTLESPGWDARGRRLSEPRGAVLTALLGQDENYRRYFAKLFAEMLNHRLTPRFLDERFDYYRTIGQQLGVVDAEYLAILRTFLDRRPDFLRELAEQYLDTDPSTRLTLRAAEGIEVTIDGFPVVPPFVGRYFPDMDVELTAAGPGPDRGVRWWINGRPVEAAVSTVRLKTAQDLTIDVRLP
jgi:hypothetical protein